MSETVSPASGEPAGLRERKKARTRAAIRQEALRLFREQGYQATTVEQIAAAAEVSPSTFFRYFPTKEDVVLQDDMEPMLIEALEQQPRELGMVAAIRASMQIVSAGLNEEQWDRLRQAAELGMTVPEIRARAMDDFSRTVTMMAEAMAKRTGLSPDDLRVRTASGAIFGAIMAATAPWDNYKGDQINANLFQRVDEALAVLQESLSLLPQAPPACYGLAGAQRADRSLAQSKVTVSSAMRSPLQDRVMVPVPPWSQANQSSSTLPEVTARLMVSVSDGGWAA